jgi:hypothetical protein
VHLISAFSLKKIFFETILSMESISESLHVKETKITELESIIISLEERLVEHKLTIQSFVEQQVLRVRSEVDITCSGAKSFIQKEVEAMESVSLRQEERLAQRMSDLEIDLQRCVHREEWEVSQSSSSLLFPTLILILRPTEPSSCE